MTWACYMHTVVYMYVGWDQKKKPIVIMTLITAPSSRVPEELNYFSIKIHPANFGSKLHYSSHLFLYWFRFYTHYLCTIWPLWYRLAVITRHRRTVLSTLCLALPPCPAAAVQRSADSNIMRCLENAIEAPSSKILNSFWSSFYYSFIRPRSRYFPIILISVYVCYI